MTAGPRPVGVPVRPVPSGAALRRWTRSVALDRSPGGVLDVLADVWTAVLTLAVVSAMVISVAVRAGAGPGSAGSAVGAGTGLDPTWVGLLLGAGAFAALAGLAARLGPVGVTPAEAAWLLPLPVDRRGLLRLASLRWAGVAAVVGAPVGASVVLSLGGTDALSVVAACVVGAATAGGAVAGLGVLQTRGRPAGRLALGTDTALAVVPLAAVVLALTGTAPPTTRGAGVVLAGAAVLLTAVAVGMVREVERSTPRLHDASLRERGGVTDEALVAVLSLDSRALGRALSARSEPARRARQARLGRVAALPPVLRAPAAVVTGDVLVLLRSARHLVRLVVAAAVPVLVLSVEGAPAGLVAAGLVTGGYVASLAACEGARRAQLVPTLDALWPLAARYVLALRCVVPVLACLAVWGVAGVATALVSDDAGWVWLGLLAAPGSAAAGVRAAYREPPDYSGPLVATPGGALPTGVVGASLRGPDVALLSALPVVLACFLGAVPVLLAAQSLCSALALVLVARPPAPAGR